MTHVIMSTSGRSCQQLRSLWEWVAATLCVFIPYDGENLLVQLSVTAQRVAVDIQVVFHNQVGTPGTHVQEWNAISENVWSPPLRFWIVSSLSPFWWATRRGPQEDRTVLTDFPPRNGS